MASVISAASGGGGGGDYITGEARPIGTKQTYRPVIMKINPRSRVNLHAKNVERGPAGPNNPDPNILT